MKSDYLGYVVLLCLIASLSLFASFFLPSASLINMYMHTSNHQFSDGHYVSNLLDSLARTVTPKVSVVTTPAG